MPSKKIKAEVQINGPETNGNGIALGLSPAQAAVVLEAVVAGEVLVVNLQTSIAGDRPQEYAA